MVSGVCENNKSGVTSQNPLSYCIVTDNSFECHGSKNLLSYRLRTDGSVDEYLTVTDYVRQLI